MRHSSSFRMSPQARPSSAGVGMPVGRLHTPEALVQSTQSWLVDSYGHAWFSAQSSGVLK